MKRKTLILVITYLSAAAIAFGIDSAVLNIKEKNYHNTAVYGYQHAYEELENAVTNLDSALKRGSYATGKSLSCSICAEIYGSCQAAEMTMSALPFSTQELEQTAGFLGVAGDYAEHILTRCTEDGFTDADRKNLADLAKISDSLSEKIHELGTELDDGSLVMDDPENVFADTSEKLLSAMLTEYESTFPQLPVLDYDGRYSEDKSPVRCEAPISKAEAQKLAADFLGEKEKELKACHSNDNGLRCFSCDDRYVSVDGFGRVISLSCSRSVAGDMPDSRLQIIARDFLKSVGFDSMKLVSSERSGGILNMKFSYTEDGIIYLPDTISISVAGDDGSIYAFDANDYYLRHKERGELSPAVSEVDASKAIPTNLSIKSAATVLVGTDGGDEVLCYEFSCTDNGESEPKIFVDAQTGAQYKISLD